MVDSFWRRQEGLHSRRPQNRTSKLYLKSCKNPLGKSGFPRRFLHDLRYDLMYDISYLKSYQFFVTEWALQKCFVFLCSLLQASHWEQRNHVVKYEWDCVIIGIGIKIWIVEGFARDCFVKFLSSAPQSNGNIISVLEQVFIPAVSHMKIANVHVRTISKRENCFAILISVCNFHISLQF